MPRVPAQKPFGSQLVEGASGHGVEVAIDIDRTLTGTPVMPERLTSLINVTRERVEKARV